MAIIGKVIFSLFIGVLIAIIIKKTANYLAAWKTSKDNIYPAVVFNNKLYGGTQPDGNLVAWNETDAWVEAALQHESETHNGGTQPDNKTFNTDERINVSQIDEEND